MLWVSVLAAAARKFCSPELSFCADSYSVSVPPCVTAVAHKRCQSFCQKCRRQVTDNYAYTLDRTKWRWADYAVQAQFGNLSGKQAHMHLIGHFLDSVKWKWADYAVQAQSGNLSGKQAHTHLIGEHGHLSSLPGFELATFRSWVLCSTNKLSRLPFSQLQ